jgi:hypothetical protein
MSMPRPTSWGIPSPAALAWYESGVLTGIEMGRRQVEDEETARWENMREHLRARLNQPSFTELCERRARHAEDAGHHESAAHHRARAARQRQILTTNGVVPLRTSNGPVYPADWPQDERHPAESVRRTDSAA